MDPKRGSRWDQDGPISDPGWIPEGTFMVPGWALDGPNKDPRGIHEKKSRWSQDWVKMGPSMTHDEPAWNHKDSKMGPKLDPSMIHDGSYKESIWLQDGPKEARQDQRWIP